MIDLEEGTIFYLSTEQGWLKRERGCGARKRCDESASQRHLPLFLLSPRTLPSSYVVAVPGVSGQGSSPKS